MQHRLALAIAVLVAFLAYLGLCANQVLPLSSALAEQATLDCALYTLLSSALVSLGVMLPWRRTDPFHPGITGALLGLCAGLAAGVSVGVLCPNREGWHLYLGHGLSFVLIAAASAWLGKRWLAP